MIKKKYSIESRLAVLNNLKGEAEILQKSPYDEAKGLVDWIEKDYIIPLKHEQEIRKTMPDLVPCSDCGSTSFSKLNFGKDVFCNVCGLKQKTKKE